MKDTDYKKIDKFKADRNKKIIFYYKNGYSYSQIGNIFHITRQRAGKIVKQNLKQN